MDVKYTDIIGLDEELTEIKTLLDILKKPEDYKGYGISLPKGLIMYGEPGTGKTLVARAVHNETKLPFYLLESNNLDFNSDFSTLNAIEEVFKKAKINAPSIIFIDELDSFLQCGPMQDYSHILMNQLLTAMDGFDQNRKVFVLAATNKLNRLPNALIRPGRFDYRLFFPLSDKNARKKALNLYVTSKVKMDNHVIDKVVQLTAGLTMAEIKYLCNEVLIHCHRNNLNVVNETDFVNAVDKYYMGISKSSHLSDQELYRLAIHETCHAVINHKIDSSESLFRLSIVKKTQSSGHVITVYDEIEKHFSKTDLLNKIKTSLAGYAGEMVFFGETSAGSENDLGYATRIAAYMVEKLGMSSFGIRQANYASNYDVSILSNEYLTKVDRAISEVIDNAYDLVKTLIEDNKDQISLVAKELVQKRVLSSEEFLLLIKCKLSHDKHNKLGD